MLSPVTQKWGTLKEKKKSLTKLGGTASVANHRAKRMKYSSLSI